MNKMNIAIVCDPITHETGGSIVSTLRFAKLLKNRGHKIIFIVAKYPKTSSIDYFQGIKTYRLFSLAMPFTEKRFRIILCNSKKFKKIFKEEKIDIVHTTHVTPSVISSIKAAKSLGIKTIAHPHTQPENIILHFPRIFQNSKIKNLIYRLIIYVSKKADIIICPTKFAEDLLKKRNDTLKTIVISNGVDISEFKKSEFVFFLKKYHLKPDNKQILCVSRLHPEKSTDTLIKAIPGVLDKYKKVHFNIVGIGPLKNDLEILSKKLGIENNISFYGKLSDKELISAYNSCDIFVLPSIAELEGMVVLEAMACGKPIIISDSKDSASKYFVKGNGFLFKLKNQEDLSEKLITLLKNDKLRERMGIKSLELSKNYDIRKSVSSLEALYYSLKKWKKNI